jgi:D-3-phosphoglycerate dehydrogenase
MIDDAAFQKMKDGVLIVNAARGGIVDEQALVRAVESGKVGGAAFDVFEKEPIDAEHPMLGKDAIVLTPHLGASTSEAQERVAVEIAEQVCAYLNDGTIKNAVNVAEVPGEVADRLAPYTTIARRLGLLLGQLGSIDIREFRVTATGEAGELGVTPVAHSALAGFLERHVDGPVNPVSAPYEAKERGFRVSEVREEAKRGHATSVHVTVQGEKGTHTVAGALGNKGEPRLVEIDGYEVDTVLEGTLLLMHNQDRPGVIGGVGSKLGSRGINVSRMQVSLDDTSGEALALWNVDSEVPEDALAELRTLDNIRSVLCIRV